MHHLKIYSVLISKLISKSSFYGYKKKKIFWQIDYYLSLLRGVCHVE